MKAIHLLIFAIIIFTFGCGEQSSDSSYVSKRDLANGIEITEMTGGWSAASGGYRSGTLRFAIRNTTNHDIDDLTLTVELECGFGWIGTHHARILAIDCFPAGALYDSCEDNLFYISDWYAQNSDPGLQVRQWNAEQNGGYLFSVIAYIGGARYTIAEHMRFPLCRQ